MHSRIVSLREPTESPEDFAETEKRYLDYDRLSVYDIDYYNETSLSDAIEILWYNFGKSNVSFEKSTMEVTIKLAGIIDRINHSIKEMNRCAIEYKPLEKFIDKIWEIRNNLQPEHPKIIWSYCGMVDVLDFAMTAYRLMRKDNLTELKFILEKCYDYHF